MTTPLPAILIAAWYPGCEAKGLTCITTELDPAYVDTICARYQLMTGEMPVRNGEPVDFGELTTVTSPTDSDSMDE